MLSDLSHKRSNSDRFEADYSEFKSGNRPDRGMQMLTALILAFTFGAPLAVWVYWTYFA